MRGRNVKGRRRGRRLKKEWQRLRMARRVGNFKVEVAKKVESQI